MLQQTFLWVRLPSMTPLVVVGVILLCIPKIGLAPRKEIAVWAEFITKFIESCRPSITVAG